MQKLIKGIIDFRNRVLPSCRHKFEELAKGQNPDALFVTCSDSRVAPNWFASTDPGDLFVIRNIGNLIPACGSGGVTTGDVAELAAVEFAIQSLNVSDIIICGHSECGAMNAIASGGNLENFPHLRSWLQNGAESLKKLGEGKTLDPSLSRVNQLSQLNVLQQIENLKTNPLIQNRLAENRLKIHGWWFDIAKADVYRYDAAKKKYIVIEN